LKKAAIKSNSNFGLAYYNAGNHYLQQHSWEKAIDCYTESLRVNPKDEASIINRGTAYLMLNDNEKAQKDFETALNLNKNLAVAYSNLGYLHFIGGNKFLSRGNYAKSEDCFEKVIELEPDEVAYKCRAEAYIYY
jgi:tetratricopeptide (TPR) repeat protein